MAVGTCSLVSLSMYHKHPSNWQADGNTSYYYTRFAAIAKFVAVINTHGKEQY